MVLRSIVTYVGGKNNVADFLINKFPLDFKHYREPFLGGGSVLIRLLQTLPINSLESIICGDLNKDIYDCWYSIKDKNSEAEKLLMSFLTNTLGTEFIVSDENIRKLWDICHNGSIDVEYLLGTCLSDYDKEHLELYLRYYVLTQLSFSGMAYNSGLSVSNSKKLLPRLLKNLGNVFDGYEGLLSGVQIYNQDFWDTIKDSGSDTFIFLDPPYYTQENSRLYGRGGNLHKGFEHQRLKECLDVVDSKGAKFLITYDDSEYLKDLYKGYNIEPYELRYCTNTAKGTRVGKEILISNYSLDIKEVDTSGF